MSLQCFSWRITASWERRIIQQIHSNSLDEVQLIVNVTKQQADNVSVCTKRLSLKEKKKRKETVISGVKSKVSSPDTIVWIFGCWEEIRKWHVGAFRFKAHFLIAQLVQTESPRTFVPPPRAVKKIIVASVAKNKQNWKMSPISVADPTVQLATGSPQKKIKQKQLRSKLNAEHQSKVVELSQKSVILTMSSFLIWSDNFDCAHSFSEIWEVLITLSALVTTVEKDTTSHKKKTQTLQRFNPLPPT